ncbi:unnamed protein product [Alopecurus aequalis]
MAEILGSAVASESVSRIFSIMSGDPREHGSGEDNAERLEFAVLKIHSVVAVSEDWQILHQPLLNWKARLKRVAKEGDGILRAYKRRSMERRRNEATTTRLQAVHRRVARAAKRFMPFGSCPSEEDDAEQISHATVRRFERLAGVGDEFFRYVQFGGRPRSLITVSSFSVPSEPLLAGKTLEFSLSYGSKQAILLLHPWDRDGDAGNPKEILLFLSYEDNTTWDKNLKLYVVFQLLEHADILDIVMSSLESILPPQLRHARVTTREFTKELLTRGTSYSVNPSSLSTWCIHAARRCKIISTGKGRSVAASDRTQLCLPIIRVHAICFTLLPKGLSHTTPDDDLPVKLRCHIAPDLVPEKHYSEHYSQIEPETMQDLFLKARNGGEPACKGNWWCPRTSTYLSVEPKFSTAPPTLQQLYLMESSERPV